MFSGGSGIVLLLIGILFVDTNTSASLPGVLIQTVDYFENGGVKNFTKSPRDKTGKSRGTACDLESSYFCSDVEDYPIKEIESLVKEVIKSSYIVGSEVLSHDHRQRSSMGVDEEQICETDRQAIFPKLMKNRKDVPTIIVQSDRLKQMIVVEKCVKSNERCSEKILVPMWHETYCKQIFSSKTLIAYDPKTNLHFEETFEFPTCCQCAIRRTEEEQRVDEEEPEENAEGRWRWLEPVLVNSGSKYKQLNVIRKRNGHGLAKEQISA